MRLLALFIMFFSFAASAAPVPPPAAKVRVKLTSGLGFPAQQDLAAEAIWEKNEEGAFEFFWRIRVELPSGKSIERGTGVTSLIGSLPKVVEGNEQPTGESSATDGAAEVKKSVPKVQVEYEEGVAVIHMKGTSDKVSLNFTDGTSASFALALSMGVKDRIWGNCEDLGLAVEPVPLDAPVASRRSGTKNSTVATDSDVSKDPPRFPGYLMFRCDTEAGGTVLSVSVPEEIVWRSTTLYESQGKGKRYKSFAINPNVVNSKETEVGRFRFLRGGKEYAFAVRVPKAQDILRLSNFTFGLGLIHLSLQASDNTAQSVKPTAIISLEFRPFWPRLVFGGHGVSSLPMVGQGKFISHTESVGFLGLTFGDENSHRIEPRGYLYFADGVSQEIDYFYSIAAPAVGLLIASPKKWKWRYSLEGFYGLLGGQRVVSGRASLGRQVGFGEWGIRGVMNSVGVNMDNSKKATGSQVAGGLYLEF